MSLNLTHLLDSLGWALLHSLWQGGVAFIIVVCFRMAFKNATPSLRYSVQIVSLIGCFVAFLVTLAMYIKTSELHMIVDETVSTVFVEPGVGQNSLEQTVIAAKQALPPLTEYTPIIAMVWVIGFAIMMMRYIMAYALTHKLRHFGLSEPNEEWSQKFRRLVDATGLGDHVKLYVSKYVDGPMTMGFLKPVILVPVGFLSRLPSDQIEAILLHEIAHIRRYDYAINLIQTAIRTVFFYHPAIHFISKRIDIDREQACDDFACLKSANPQALVKGLAALTFNATPDLAMAAKGREMPVLARLKRLAGYREAYRRPEHAIMSALTALVIGVGYIGAVTRAEAYPPAPVAPEAPIAMRVEAPELPVFPKLPKLVFTEYTDGQKLKAYMQKDSQISVKFDVQLSQFEKELKAYSKSANADSKIVKSLREKGNYMADKLDAKIELRQADLKQKYNKYVEAKKWQKEKSKDQNINRAKTQNTEYKKKKVNKVQKSSYNKKAGNRLHDHETFRQDVTTALLADGLIKTKSETISFSHPNKITNLNGEALPKSLRDKYCEIFEKNGLTDKRFKLSITPKNIKVLTDFDGYKYKTRITYGEWTNDEDDLVDEVSYKPKSYKKAKAASKSWQEASSSSLPFIWPSSSKKVSAEFGVVNKTWPKSHKGIDIPAPLGSAVYASAEGVVSLVSDDNKWGKRIIIAHPDGRETLYAHLKKIKVNRGESVKLGELIALSGSTGVSKGPHLHFEIRQGGRSVNPRDFIN